MRVFVNVNKYELHGICIMRRSDRRCVSVKTAERVLRSSPPAIALSC